MRTRGSKREAAGSSEGSGNCRKSSTACESRIGTREVVGKIGAEIDAIDSSSGIGRQVD